jgi:hypothetical protein
MISPIEAEILDIIVSFNCNISMQWLPGHAGFPGNERADALASTALTSDTSTTRIDVDLDFILLRARTFLKESWKITPLGDSNESIAPIYTLRVEKLYRKLTNSPSDTQKLITRLLVNHYNLKGCYFRHALDKNGLEDYEAYLCRFCQSSIETSFHIVDDCTFIETKVQRAALLAAIPYEHRRSGSLLLDALQYPGAWPAIIFLFSNLYLCI